MIIFLLILGYIWRYYSTQVILYEGRLKILLLIVKQSYRYNSNSKKLLFSAHFNSF